MSESCFHCGDAVPQANPLHIEYEGISQPVCCSGCQAVCELIIAGGQADYYRYRDNNAERVDQQLLESLAQWEVFDKSQRSIDSSGLAQEQLLVEGIHCSACGWLIEQQLGRLPGVESVHVEICSGLLQGILAS